MVVDVQGGQAADVDLVLALLGQGVGELVVQAVDALDHQHVPGAQGQLVAIVLPDALLEVVGGHIHRFALQQAAHVAVELLHVHGPQALEIVLAVGILGGVLPVAEVVVRGDGVGPQAAGDELGGQAVGEGGLAGGRGPGDHYKADVLPAGDLLGNVADPLFHQGLVGQDHLGGLAAGYDVVHLGYVGDVHGGGAVLGVVHGPEDLHGWSEGSHLLRVFQGGQAENEAVLKGLQGEPAEVAGVRHHVAIEIVGEAVQSVEVHPGADAVVQEPGLVLHAVGLQESHGLLNVHGPLFDGQGLVHKSTHPLLYLGQQVSVQGKAAVGLAEQGVAEGELHPDVFHIFPARHVVKSLEHQQNGTALIGLAARLVRAGDHGEGAVPLEGLVQLPELAVPVHQQDLVGIFRLKISGNGAVGGAVRVLVHPAVDGHVHHLCSFHKGLLLSMAADASRLRNLYSTIIL